MPSLKPPNSPSPSTTMEMTATIVPVLSCRPCPGRSSYASCLSRLPLALLLFVALLPASATSSSKRASLATTTTTATTTKMTSLFSSVQKCIFPGFPSSFSPIKRPNPVRSQQRHPLALADSRLGLHMQALLGRTNNGTRLALAGALAGGFSNLVLYPIDLAKTLKQAGPSSKGASLASQARIYGLGSLWAGLTPAIVGSMPSSALYFGVYEYVKRRLTVLANASSVPMTSSSPSSTGDDLYGQRPHILRRWLVHAVAAASGNTASSLVFVPKEVLKQQLQMYRNSHGGSSTTLPRVLASILKDKGILGLYSGYRATLLRNIPSAILRFALYEEFKLFLGGGGAAAVVAAAGATGAAKWLSLSAPQVAIAAGALAGAFSSAATTPLDVVKTRMAINACPPGRDVLGCLVEVAQREGVPGLYAGLGFRVLYSALFTAVGFSSFEASKALLGVGDGERQGGRKKE